MISEENFSRADKFACRLVAGLTLSEKIGLMCQHQDAVPRLGIKAYKHGTEAAHGIAWLGKATVFPQPAGLACSWDTDLMQMVGEVIGIEARGFFSRDPEKSGLTLWAPTVDLNRDPRWGRTEESYGEDPVLAANLAAALIRGIQGDDPAVLRAAPTLKHFYGNNNEHNRGSCSISISERIKREYYLKVFRTIIEKSGVLSIMTGYNAINGIPANLNPDLQDIVRDEWEWKGFVVSDAYDISSLVSEHKYVKTDEEAAALSVKAGIDSITDDHEKFIPVIRNAIDQNILSEEYLDIALERCFRLRCLLGEFPDYADNPYSYPDEKVICSEEHEKTAYKAAVKSAVLLKNESAGLPVEPGNGSIILIGNMTDRVYRDWYSGEFCKVSTPAEAFCAVYKKCSFISANDKVTIRDNISGFYVQPDGSLKENASVFEMEDWGWSACTFRSTETGKYLTCTEDTVSGGADEIGCWFTKEVFYTKTGDAVGIKTWNTGRVYTDNTLLKFSTENVNDGKFGFSNPTPDFQVKSEKGDFCISVIEDGIKQAAGLASAADIPVVMIGNHPLINGKETVDRLNLDLPDRQYRLASRIADISPKAVLVIISSYPYAIGGLARKYKSVIYTAHGGQAAGQALADLISGKANPAGRLPLTWYKSTEDAGSIMDYELAEAKKTYLYFDREVLYPFGHGLSYSEFRYSAFELKEKQFTQSDVIDFKLTVSNRGVRDGEEVVQIYLKKPESSVSRPLRQLADFQRIFIPAGEKKVLHFTVPASELQFWDEDNSCWSWETGDAQIMIGSSSSDIRILEKIKLV